jgi:hypothetical protein
MEKNKKGFHGFLQEGRKLRPSDALDDTPLTVSGEGYRL